MMTFNDVIKKLNNGEILTKPEIIKLLSYDESSMESYLIMAESNRISKGLTDNLAEVHAQLALNLAPCKGDCMFCSFAHANEVFTSETRLSPMQAVAYAKQFEADGANAVYVMTTAQYPFELFIEISQEIRRNLKAQTVMVANVGDQTLRNARKLKDAGYTGVYHALRLREGIDSNLSPASRKKSIHNFFESGLKVGTCVEPVGPEHTNEELADLILFTGSINPVFSGAARRIPIPGTKMATLGTINELRMAQIVAVTRLTVPRNIAGNCTHEPCTLGAIAGANLFWAEAGGNPRDIKEKTEEGRGESTASCSSIFTDSGWGIYKGPSRYFTPA
jgi:biotin synthase